MLIHAKIRLILLLEGLIMPRYSVTEIESLTDTVHATMNNNNDTVINVINIAQQLGFNVFASDFTENNIDGMVINSHTEKSIYVNKNDMPERQRFTIAHELGHIILHHSNQGEEYQVVDYRGNNTQYDPKEHEANNFAASLLMPKEKSIYEWNRLNDVDDFAQTFKVSRSAAAIRLNNLGLI